MTNTSEPIEEGMVVRDRKWGGRQTGTVVRREGDSIFVAWHGTCVEDELAPGDVEIWADAPEHLRRWRGGVGVIQADGGVVVESIDDLRA